MPDITPEELRKLADEEQAVPYSQPENRTCDLVVDVIRRAADTIERQAARIAELEQQVAELRANHSTP